MKLAHYLLRLYPQQWRQRYGEELLDMLEQHPISLLDGIDLLLGALDAHLHPNLGIAAMPWPERISLMLSTLRRSLLTIFCAYSGFIVAGIGFQKLTEDKMFVVAAQNYSIVGLSFHLVMIGAVVALLAALIGGLPIATAIAKDALMHKHYGRLFLLATPILALAVFIGTTLLLEILIPVGAPIVPTFLARGIFIAVFLGAAIVSVTALCWATAHSEIGEKFLDFAVLPSFLITLAMAVMLVATLVWGLSLHSSAPQLFNGNGGIFSTSTALSWLHIVITMAIATGLAVIALIRGLSARSVLHTTVG